MNNKKNLLVKVLLAVMVTVGSVGFISCGKKGDDKKPVNYGETGIYYFTTIDEEYQITLGEGKYTLKIEDTYLEGKYGYDGTTLNLYGKGNGGDIIGSIENNILTISYNGGIYKFYKKVNYTVTFDVDGGNAMQSVTVVNGMSMSKPADPVKDGYYFVGWYADKAYTKPFAFGSDIITADTTLYARFVAQSTSADEYTATLYVDGEVVDVKTTVGGVLYGLPTPTKTNDTFVGWWISDYQQADKLTYQYTSDQALAQDVNLYAVWASDGLNVSVTADAITWSTLGTGVEYNVVIKYNGTVVETKNTTSLSMAYDFAAANAGDYTVTVEANGKTAVAYYNNKALARVSNFSVEGSTLVFGAVENAEKYLITVVCGNSAHKHTDYDNGNSTTFNFANCDMKAGGIEFVVKAVATGYVTSVSDTYVYNLELDAVSGVNYDTATGYLTWNAVANATNYVVTVKAGGALDTYTISETTLSMKQYTGAVSVEIKAVCKGYNSGETTNYTCTIATLPSPVVTFAYNKVLWTAVDGASSYVVKIDSKEYQVASGTEFVLPAEYNVDGKSFAISVKAVGTSSSFYSDEISVTYGEIAEISYSANNLHWGYVGGANSYVVKLNGETVATLDSAASQAKITFAKAGNNTLTVYAYDVAGNELDAAELNVVSYQVAFDVQGGSAVKSVYAAAGDKIAPSEPTKEGYDFTAWYSAPNGPQGNGQKFDLANDTITGPTLLYAYWSPAAFEVELMVGKTVYNAETDTYEYVLESYATELVYYRQNYTLSIPESDDPSKIFGGWYEDDDRSSFQYTDAKGNSTGIWTKLGGHTLFAGWIDVLSYELVEEANGKSWHVTGGEGAQYATEITVPAAYTDPVTKKTYPVTQIGTRAFAENKYLRVLNIPDTLESIFLAFGSTTSTMSTGSALYECRNLQAINVYCVDEDGEHDEFSTHETYYSSHDGMLVRHASPNTESLQYGVELVFVPFNIQSDLIIPDVVEHIPQRTFYMLNNCKKVVIPASVGRIGDRAFYRSYFEEIIFEEAPEGVDEKPLLLSEGALDDVTTLTKVVLPTRMGAIDLHVTNMFSHDKMLLKYEIVGRPTPEQEASNDYYTSVDGVICNYDGTKLVYVSKFTTGTFTIPANVEIIGERAFLDCWLLESVIIKDNVKLIEGDAFKNCRILDSVVFDYERGSLSIESKAFYGLEELTSIEFPEQLTYLGSHAFGGTTKLQTITINGASNATLEWGAFAEESGRNKGYVTTVNLGANAPAFEVNSVFYGCNLYMLNIDDNNTNFTVEDGVLYDDAKTTILYYPFGLTENYTIPSTVTTIGEGVFENRANLTSIEIPANVTSISFNAFKNCVALETLTFAPRTTDLYIAPSAFAGCIALKSVSLPEGMVELNYGVFENCSNITNVHIPSTMRWLTLSDSFVGCKKLATITVANNNQYFGIYDGILYRKDGNDLVSVLFVPENISGEVVIPSSVTEIGAGMFRGKTNVTSISFENNMAHPDLVLGDAVFEGMTSLSAVTLPTGLRVIPTDAFKGSSITSVFVPNTVEQVMPGAFANCKKLTEVTLEDGEYLLEFAPATLTTGAFYNTPNLTSITLPNRMAEIGKYMFAYSSISEINLPEWLDIIGEGAFANNTSLTSFVMPDTVSMVESFAFSGCTSLETVTLSNSLTAIPDYLFGKAAKGTGSSGGSSSGGGKDDGGKDDGGTPIAPPKKANVTPQYKDSGKDEGGKDDIIVDDGTVRLSEDVGAATALKSIVIPEFVESIGKGAFQGCISLATVTFVSNENLYSIGDVAFVQAGITSFDMPNSVDVLGNYVFAGCSKLVSATLSENLTIIPTGTFDKQYKYEYTDAWGGVYTQTETVGACSSLSSIVIPTGITAIGDYAFRDTVALTNVVFGDCPEIISIGVSAFESSGIKTLDLSDAVADTISLGSAAFAGSGLEVVSLPFSVKSLGNAFIGCSHITTFEIADDGDDYIDNDMFNVDADSLVVYNGNRTELKLYVGNATEFVIPNDVKKIWYNAFRGNTTLTKVTVPASVQIIEDAAFALCTALKTVEFAEDSQLKTIGFRAFAFSGLEEITIPETVNSINTHTYKVGLPRDEEVENYRAYLVGQVGESSADTLINQLTSGWDSTSWKGRTFESCVYLTKVNVKTVALSEAMFRNCYALEDVTLNTNTNTFNGYTFENCTSLTSIELPSNLTWVGKQDFANSGLTSIHIPAGLQFETTPRLINYNMEGAGMFMGCDNLTTATMDDSYTVIPYRFFDSTGITTFTLPKKIMVIGEQAFSQCENLTTIIFPETYQSTLTIMTEAFGYCPNLTGENGGFDFSDPAITFTWASNSAGTSFKTASSMFQQCKSIEWLKFNENFTAPGNMFFSGCENLVSVEAPGITDLSKNNLFTNCHKLETVILSDDLQSIGYAAFANCYALKEFTIPDSVTEIAEQAFRNTGLESIVIGSGITYLPSQAFAGSKAKTIYIPASVATIDASAFLGCSELVSFTVDSANRNYRVGDCGELYNSTNVLMYFPAASTGDNGSFAMPTTSILGAYAFYGAKNITSVEVSPATSVIPTGAFQDSLISNVVLTSNVTRIGAFAFKNCVNLVTIDLPSTIVDPEYVEEVDFSIRQWIENEYYENGGGGMFSFDENYGIGEAAFEGCTALTSVNIPKYMTTLAPKTFKGCTSLTTIEIPYGLEIIGTEAFAESGLVEIVIPDTVIMLGTMSDMGGGKDEGGKRKGETSSVYGAVFANCTSLKKVVFESVVMDVYFDTFIGCTALEEVVFANGWTTIVDGMFNGCTSLNIELPATIETVGVDAFAGWTADQTITINISIEKANLLWGEGWNGDATVIEK